MIIRNEKVILRPYLLSDIEDRIYWETIEMEWLLWDAPWEEHKFEPEKYRREMTEWLKNNKNSDNPQSSFQICINDEKQTHIGWCNTYLINEDFEYTEKGPGYITIGIDIPPVNARGQGYAFAAWSLLIQYWLDLGYEDIFTQSWSGNHRIIGLARKLGFVEIDRKEKIRTVRGKKYDALTFHLSKEAWEEIKVEQKDRF